MEGVGWRRSGREDGLVDGGGRRGDGHGASSLVFLAGRWFVPELDARMQEGETKPGEEVKRMEMTAPPRRRF